MHQNSWFGPKPKKPAAMAVPGWTSGDNSGSVLRVGRDFHGTFKD
jgi:hypothetical protein